MDDASLGKLIGFAKLLLGLGLTAEGYSILAGARRGNGVPSLLGGPSSGRLAGAPVDDTPGFKKASLHSIGSIDERLSYIKKLMRKSSLDPKVKERVFSVLTKRCNDGTEWCIAEKDYIGEIRAIFKAIRDPKSPLAIRYTRDHVSVDQFASARRTFEVHAGDCFVKGTKVLRADHQLVPVESLRVGDKIWGYDRWSEVTNTWEKGILQTWLIRLNNGSSMRLTPDHKVWVATCDSHDGRLAASPCSCPVSERNVHRVRVRDLRPNDVVLQPERVDYGSDQMDSGRAYVEGLYLSDGSSGHPQTFEIAGQDGCPKEAQKREVEAICQRLGIATTWQRKYISVKDKAWAERLQQMGGRAPQKHALSIDLQQAAADELLRGILADSGVNTCGKGRTFTTTSRELWLQTRVLLKMAGYTASERYIVDHGGLGTNPIWRLQIRAPKSQGGKGKLLRVKEVIRDGVELPCFDFETDDHFVWLPEADWTTSQCDDYSITLGAALMACGYPVKCRVIQTKGASSWSHIYLLVGVPPTGPTKWIPLDASVNKPAGWEAPGAAECAETGRPSGMVVKVKDYEV